ncbi:hypothetical protein GCM10007278_14840 [Paenalcaligenes hominis]|nr:hypothetical protein GCM10007278_14840 [Paenalcaligenes hominis]
MSNRARRLSKSTEAVYRFTRSETGSVKRADQAWDLFANWFWLLDELDIDDK